MNLPVAIVRLDTGKWIGYQCGETRLPGEFDTREDAVAALVQRESVTYADDAHSLAIVASLAAQTEASIDNGKADADETSSRRRQAKPKGPRSLDLSPRYWGRSRGSKTMPYPVSQRMGVHLGKVDPSLWTSPESVWVEEHERKPQTKGCSRWDPSEGQTTHPSKL